MKNISSISCSINTEKKVYECIPIKEDGSHSDGWDVSFVEFKGKIANAKGLGVVDDGTIIDLDFEEPHTCRVGTNNALRCTL
jgi:hypothetical protein